MIEQIYTYECIESLVDKWCLKYLSNNFKFRIYQKETTIETILGILQNKSNIIINAPTGSGKSMIAIITAGVLSEYYDKTGYILISDLSLIQQYEDIVNKYLQEWCVIKGQRNYTCLLNGFSFNSGQCKLSGCESYNDIIKNFPNCSSECEYIILRNKAISAKITLCTYSFWLIQHNLVNRIIDGPFKKRDFVICDECHKIVDIVQDYFSPKISKSDEDKIKILKNIIEDSDKNIKEITKVRKLLFKESQDKEEIYNNILVYTKNLETISTESKIIKTQIAEKNKENNIFYTKEDRKIINACEWVTDTYGKFADYCKVISEGDIKYIIDTQNRNILTNEIENVSYRYINESYLMKHHFLCFCDNFVYMSATIGDPKEYAKSMNIEDYIYYILPSTYNFTNSPIFYIGENKLSYIEKETSFFKNIKILENILELYKDKKGIIQTGNYQFAFKIKKEINNKYKNRIIIYEDSADKKDKLDEFKNSSNSILVGPSLLEGLSFDNDLCRFLVIFKVPFPSLGDKYVKTKKDIYPPWYANKTILSILQGIGRGIRNENDWCVTFIIDGCFGSLLSYNRSMFGEDFIKRVQIINSETLKIN